MLFYKDFSEAHRELRQYFAQHGMAEDRFDTLISSEAIKASVKQADALWKSSGATGTPSITINDRYLVLSKNIKSLNDIVNISQIILDVENQ